MRVHLFENGLEGLEDLRHLVSNHTYGGTAPISPSRWTYLELNLGLSDVLLATTTADNLLGLGNLGANGLSAEILKGVTLNGVDAELGAGLDNGKATGNYSISCKPKGFSDMGAICCCCCRCSLRLRRTYDVRKYCLLEPLSSITSTRPGFNCSMEGTWLARTPISPETAGMLTWTTSWDL